jgi:hypothetical protein
MLDAALWSSVLANATHQQDSKHGPTDEGMSACSCIVTILKLPPPYALVMNQKGVTIQDIQHACIRVRASPANNSPTTLLQARLHMPPAAGLLKEVAPAPDAARSPVHRMAHKWDRSASSSYGSFFHCRRKG